MSRFSYELHFSDGEVIDGISDDAIFETDEEAEEAATYASGCASLGNEILNMSNPGDYPLDGEGTSGIIITELDEDNNVIDRRSLW